VDPDEPSYRHGAQVTLTAHPAPGWHFTNWTGDATGDQNPLTITMTGDKQITANFARDEYVLEVSIVGRGNVVRFPDQGTYYLGDRVTLTAWAPLTWHFQDWSGDLSGSDNPITVFMTGNRRITATFVPNAPGTKYRAYLAGLLEAWPRLPGVPALQGISNPGGHGDYSVLWSKSLWCNAYTLEEATNPGFTDAKQLYHGPLTGYEAKGRGAARYYYRVKGHNALGASPWSNVATSDVRWEAEPNEEPRTQANGPLALNLVYFGTFPSAADQVDYFFIDLTIPQRMQISLTRISTGHNYDLVLQDVELRPVARSEGAGDVDEQIETRRLDPGRYYVRVVNAGGTGSEEPYNLRLATW
jgi:uncharacterized repeat protein (TIGR02543 family)